ncbi:CHAD domain-containing protein [Agrococcus sp. DT81.2]|uniref:CYTH and CHAD domain-containing protein n=1 Tax=Agrococcus sp. DT81.2 TaxID=3393414 RepID=UPI003CE5BFC4
MTTRHHEVETKLEAPADAAVPPLEAIEGIAAVDAPAEHRLTATYFDTPSGALAAAGISLRRRTGGDDAGWHLKLPVDGGRDELRLPPGRATREVPEPLRDAARLFVRDEPLQPIAEIRTHRTVHRLRDADERVLVEIADDAVEARPLPSGAALSWREWEVEVVDGEREHLDAVAAVLEQAGATPAAVGSKVARLLGRDGGSRAEREAGDGSAASVLQAALREQVAELRTRDPLVRADVEGSVHRMRVAARRLRSLLAAFRPLLDATTAGPLRDELRWIASLLGDARDAEVLRARLAALVAAEPVELVMGPVAQRLDDELSSRYRSAHERAVEAMRSERYLRLMDELAGFAADPPWTAAAVDPGALRARVRRELRRLRRRAAVAQAAPAGAARDARLHETRKAAKRARYAAEVLEPIDGRDAVRSAKAAKRVQSVLGEQHDTVIARTLLRKLGVRAHLAGENAFGYGLLHAREQASAETLERDAERAWARASRKRLRRWLR